MSGCSLGSVFHLQRLFYLQIADQLMIQYYIRFFRVLFHCIKPPMTTIFVLFQSDQSELTIITQPSNTIPRRVFNINKLFTAQVISRFLLTHLHIYFESLRVELQNDFHSSCSAPVCQLCPFYQNQTKRKTKLGFNESWEAIHRGSLRCQLHAVYSFTKMPLLPRDANVDDVLSIALYLTDFDCTFCLFLVPYI